MRIKFHSDAEIELAEAIQYHRDSRRGYGEIFFEAFYTAYDWLETYPHIGPRTTPRLRRKRIMGFPYNVLYRVMEDHILIVAVAHHARGPEYLREAMRRR